MTTENTTQEQTTTTTAAAPAPEKKSSKLKTAAKWTGIAAGVAALAAGAYMGFRHFKAQ